MTETEIDGRIIPIEPGPKIIITFSAGQEGPQGAGTFEFWVSVSPPLSDCVRCREGADPGERFQRMEGDPDYKEAWERARRAKRLRPATLDEVELWLNGHASDACHAESGEVEGHKVNIVQKDGRYVIKLA